MKKIMLILVVFTLVAFPVTVYAENGVPNNPNHFEIDMNCGGEIVHATVPNSFGLTPGFTDDGRVAHPVTHKLDTDLDGDWDIEIVLSKGKSFDTVLCTWMWDNDPYLHGMDIWFSPAD